MPDPDVVEYSLDELQAPEQKVPETDVREYSLDEVDNDRDWGTARNVFQVAAGSYAKGFQSDVVRIPGEIGQLMIEQGENGESAYAIPSFNDGVKIARMLTGTEIERGTQDNIMIKAGEMLSKKNTDFVNRMGLKPEEGSKLSQIAFDLGAGTSSVATSVGLLYATRSPSLLFALFGARQKAQIYEESKLAGKTPEEASVLSSMAGLVEGGVEALGGSMFLRAAGFNKFLTKALFRTAEQGVEEGLQQAGEEAFTHVAQVRKDSVRDILLRVGYATALGMVIGAPAGSISTSLEKMGIKSQLKKAGISEEKATAITNKVIKQTMADDTVKFEINDFLEQEMAKTEQAVNENPMYAKPEEQGAEGAEVQGQEVKSYKKWVADKKTTELLTEDKELKPEKTKFIDKVAMADAKTGEVFAYKVGENEVYNHGDIFVKHGMSDETVISGFIDKEGNFVYQYPEEAYQKLVKYGNTEIDLSQKKEQLKTPGLASGENIQESVKPEPKQEYQKPSALSSLYDTISGGLSKIAEPISTRLKKINPSLKNKLRRYEFDLKQTTLQDEKAVTPFLVAYEKLSEKDRADLDIALKNSDMATVNEIAERNNMTEAVSKAKEALGALHKRAKKTGLDIGFIKDYFPRKVKDYKAMLEYFGKQDTWPAMQRALMQKEESLGRNLEEDEKVDLFNSMLKGRPQVGASKPGGLKKRQISKIEPELNQFYQESPQALLNYIYKVNDFIEARRFFGKSVKGSEMNEKTLENSIGSFVLGLLESGEIKGSQAQEVSDILKARFAQRGTSGLVSAVKNVTYIETMGSVISAVTQIGDIGFSLYKNGFYKTGSALLDTLANKAQVTKEDIGIERIAEEFAEKSTTASALNNIFKLTGLSYMDRLGKQTQINAAFKKYSELAQSPSKEFKDEMKVIFGDEAEQTISDFKNQVVSDNVKYMLFSELADVQPVALSEMPEYYLNSGNGRIFYMLKTFTIKQIDLFRNEVFLQMKDNPTKAIGNLIKLSSMLMLANATSDIIKDLLLGRPSDPEDYVIDNLLRLLGLSKYTLYKFKKEGVKEGMTSFVVPPFGESITSASKDVDKMIKGEFDPSKAEIIKSVPLLGKIYYWWFGAGLDKKNKTNKVRWG